MYVVVFALTDFKNSTKMSQMAVKILYQLFWVFFNTALSFFNIVPYLSHVVPASVTFWWLAVPTAAPAVSQFLCTCEVSIWLSLVWQLYRFNCCLTHTGCAASGAETLPLSFCRQSPSDDTSSGRQHLQTASPAIQPTHLHHPASPMSHFPQTQPWNTFPSHWHKTNTPD